jgi:serine/threonine-protein kinase
MIQCVFATTYVFARSSRRATAIAIERVNRANLKIREGEALLAEVRGDLDRALRPGEGRYTGAVVAGYLLGEIVGRGGMGEVYRGENDKKHVAAVKLLHPYKLADEESLARFEREAELARRVTSPYVARILDSGTTTEGLPFVAMELLVGRDLAWHLRQTPRFTTRQVIELVDHASRALAAIRKAGIVHRDVKPQNFILVEGAQPIWKLLDFGVSRYEAHGRTITLAGIVGTPSYMAPEQVQQGLVDHRTDIYALGAVAYRALTGKPAFSGQDMATVLFRVVHEPPARPGEDLPLHEDVDLVLAIAMAKDQAERFEEAMQFADALRNAVRGELDEATRERGRRIVAKHPWWTRAASPASP